ncbi:MAG: hypothetical protein N2235_10910 [Fischerella sp.]|nr:hypothetical protein [Fischerella sp.]
MQLPLDLPIQVITKEALSQNVLIFSGSAFFPDKHGYPAMRLTFANSQEDIEKGIYILGNLLKKYIYTGRERISSYQSLAASI